MEPSLNRTDTRWTFVQLKPYHEYEFRVALVLRDTALPQPDVVIQSTPETGRLLVTFTHYIHVLIVKCHVS